MILEFIYLFIFWFFLYLFIQSMEFYTTPMYWELAIIILKIFFHWSDEFFNKFKTLRRPLKSSQYR